MEPLEEIQPEVTPEGFGLKTPYGTHLDLDFMKYCETLSKIFSVVCRLNFLIESNNFDLNQIFLFFWLDVSVFFWLDVSVVPPLTSKIKVLVRCSMQTTR